MLLYIFTNKLLFPHNIQTLRVQSEVVKRGCKSYPPVLFWVHVFLEKLLGVIIPNEGQVPAAPLAPSLSAEKTPLKTHKFIAGALERLLVLWAGMTPGSCLATGWDDMNDYKN